VASVMRPYHPPARGIRPLRSGTPQGCGGQEPHHDRAVHTYQVRTLLEMRPPGWLAPRSPMPLRDAAAVRPAL